MIGTGKQGYAGPMDFEAGAEVRAAPGDAGGSGDVSAKDMDGVPYCRLHHCRMRSRSAAAKTKGKDYYRCPVEGCEETGIRIRAVETIVPADPLPCPRCSSDKKSAYCERDARRSTATGVVLHCPGCGWSAGMFVVPQLEALRRSRGLPGPMEQVGDR